MHRIRYVATRRRGVYMTGHFLLKNRNNTISHFHITIGGFDIKTILIITFHRELSLLIMINKNMQIFFLTIVRLRNSNLMYLTLFPSPLPTIIAENVSYYVTLCTRYVVLQLKNNSIKQKL